MEPRRKFLAQITLCCVILYWNLKICSTDDADGVKDDLSEKYLNMDILNIRSISKLSELHLSNLKKLENDANDYWNKHLKDELEERMRKLNDLINKNKPKEKSSFWPIFGIVLGVSVAALCLCLICRSNRSAVHNYSTDLTSNHSSQPVDSRLGVRENSQNLNSDGHEDRPPAYREVSDLPSYSSHFHQSHSSQCLPSYHEHMQNPSAPPRPEGCIDYHSTSRKNQEY